MAVDSATRAILDQMASAGGRPLHESTPEEARALGQAIAAMAGPAPKMASSEDHQLPVAGSTIPVRVLVPPQGARGVIVYLHGGGWVIGSIDEYDTMARKLAERTSCAVVLVGYRLAPEHPYPTAVDDSYAAVEWAAAHLEEITGRSDAPLIVAGDSAGGNLAAVMARRARDRNGPEVALQVLIYPVTDADVETPSYVDPENQLLLTRDAMVWFWDHYAPDASRRTEPDASPLRAESLAGLPPAVVITAEHDVLRDEGEAYAHRLEEAGVPVDFKRHDRQAHGFFTILLLPGSERGFQQVVKAVRGCTIHHSRGQRSLSTS
ncbi:MAG: alpha/beta hydrolase fold domain-containing protein [Acidimicrobiia bacterium]|nr:alpha/beta hydrolase fold domain-containing protein [Acidimicrobiia bacterium]